MKKGFLADGETAVLDVGRVQRAKRSVAEEGFCAGGCLLLLVVLALIIGAVIWGGLSTYQGIYLMTSPGPRAFEPIPSMAAQSAARAKWQAMLQSISQGRAIEFRFSAEDLNAWFFGDGRNGDLASHLRFAIQSGTNPFPGFEPNVKEDWLVADVSIPLGFMAELPGLPKLRNRYFNGRIATRLTVENQELKLKSLDIEGNGHRLPWLFTGQGYRDTVKQTLEQGIRSRLPEGDAFLSRLESLRIENGQIVVRFRGE
jgi:hypothetical protein